MSSTNQNQLQKRNWLTNLFYKIVQMNYDKVDIRINGERPEDIQIKNESFYFKLMIFICGLDRKLFGECYMDEYFEVDDLIKHVEKSSEISLIYNRFFIFISNLVQNTSLLFFNMQSITASKSNIAAHYNLGNDLFKLMLDKSMNYSCGYWQKFQPISEENPSIMINTLCSTLDEAQLNKMHLIARKLNLKPGMTVLDIGCGWGYLAKFLALNFGVNVVGVTISKEQFEYATKTDLELKKLDFLRIQGLKLVEPGKFEFKFKDYREIYDTYDRIVSVGMIEHVGKKNYNEFFKIAKRCLKKDGLFLLHTIAITNHFTPQLEPWITKYVFPNGMVPTHIQLIDSIYGKFIIEDWHNFGFDYYRTLECWLKNFNDNWSKIEHNYGHRFERMWRFYLCYCAGLFKARKIDLLQIVLSEKGFKNGYLSIR